MAGRQNNRIPILVSGGVFVLLFIALICNMSYFVATSKQALINNSYNSRQELLLSKTIGEPYIPGMEKFWLVLRWMWHRRRKGSILLQIFFLML